ncbi:hypothetical protein [Streptomyces sp. NPDC012510]|uniref:hypothetical protein n=1 Tax=Streptomyces sp. NPDC012510 TaxID=3364838 RepID=UPI0036F0736C
MSATGKSGPRNGTGRDGHQDRDRRAQRIEHADEQGELCQIRDWRGEFGQIRD